MTDRQYDARAVANRLLDKADARGLSLSNLALQKLLYFSHVRYLVRHRSGLVDGYFVGWKHGPVHLAAYEAFKVWGRQPILGRAVRHQVHTGTTQSLQMPPDADADDVLDEVLISLGRLPAHRLVALSHAKGGPWDYIVNGKGTESGLGLRISDTVILGRLAPQKVVVGVEVDPGEPLEDAPPS